LSERACPAATKALGGPTAWSFELAESGMMVKYLLLEKLALSWAKWRKSWIIAILRAKKRDQPWRVRGLVSSQP
jgi:hypothetical protein